MRRLGKDLINVNLGLANQLGLGLLAILLLPHANQQEIGLAFNRHIEALRLPLERAAVARCPECSIEIVLGRDNLPQVDLFPSLHLVQ